MSFENSWLKLMKWPFQTLAILIAIECRRFEFADQFATSLFMSSYIS